MEQEEITTQLKLITEGLDEIRKLMMYLLYYNEDEDEAHKDIKDFNLKIPKNTERNYFG